ncbi:MAG: TylF/MycF/NovP-related O-methyltransferase [Microthrixaceae bacterium]
MTGPRDAVVRAGKASVLWLRDRRRLERFLARLPIDGERSRFSHRLVAPTATLSPWYDDEAFLATYGAVADNTLVDIYRCWDLWAALPQVAEVPGDVLEVGVWRGGTGALMAQRALLVGLDATVILADTFRGVVGAGSEDPWYRGGEHADTSAQLVQRLLDGFPGVRTELVEGVFPDDTGSLLVDRRFRLVHIDVDVYESAKATLEWVWPRLGVGGMVIFDDYGFYECEGVAALGAELMAAAGSALRGVSSLNGHLTLVKLADEPLPTC